MMPWWPTGGRVSEREPDGQSQLRESKYGFPAPQKFLCRGKGNCDGGQCGSVRICRRLSDVMPRVETKKSMNRR